MVDISEKELESDDPYEFVARRFPVAPGVDNDEVTARCFIEEYALMGMPRERMMVLFRSPAFAGTHDILARRGRPFIEQLIDDVFGPKAAAETEA